MAFNNMNNNYQASRYIVDADGTTPFSTIQSAIDQTVTDGLTSATILIRPGTYTENLVLVAGIDLQGSEGEVFVRGTHTPPAAGSIMFSNIKFTTATSVLFDAAAGTCAIKFYDCTFYNGGGIYVFANYICDLALWTGDIIIESCSEIAGCTNGIIFNNGAAAVDIIDCHGIGSGAVGARFSGVTRIFNSKIFCDLLFVSNAVLQIQDSTIDSVITISDPAQGYIYNSYLTHATTCLIDDSLQDVKLGNVVINVAGGDAIAGVGTNLEIGEVVFMTSASIAGTVTVIRLNECKSGNFTTYGNFNLPETEDTGFGGIITQGAPGLPGTPFIHSMGTDNVFMGSLAGNLGLTVGSATDNVGIGANALNSVTTGAHLTAIGSAAGTNVTTGSNCILIDNPGIAAENQTIRIGTSQTANYQMGIYQASSGATKEVVWIDSNFKLSSSNTSIIHWVKATASLTAAVNTAYFVDIAVPGLLSILLPASAGCVIGDTIEISGISAGMWSITQNAGDQIIYGAVATTVGAAGHLDATNRYDTVRLVYYEAGLWKVEFSIGVLNAL